MWKEELKMAATRPRKGRDGKTENGKCLSPDSKSMDRVMRLFLALRWNPEQKYDPDIALKLKKPETDQTAASPNDLVYVHMVSSSTLGNDDQKDGMQTLQQIVCHPALLPLEESAQLVAASYIFQAHLAHRLRTVGKYWVLEGTSPIYPFPLGIKTGSFPRWRRQARSLSKVFKSLQISMKQVAGLQNGNLVSSRPERMSAALLSSAAAALQTAIHWMEAFPEAVSLRSTYRELMHPATDAECVRVVAYVLWKLYREHRREPSLKVKEVECRIAELETSFLGQNIQYNSEEGCPAVRLQIRSVKQADIQKAIDGGLLDSFKRFRCKLKEVARNSNSSRAEALERLWKRLERHWEASIVWQRRTESSIDEAVRIRLGATEYADEVHEATQEYAQRMKNYFHLIRRWLTEYEEHVNAMGSLDADVYENSKATRKWMRGWDAVWALP